MSDPCVDPRLVLPSTLVSPTHQTINYMGIVRVTSQWSSRVTLKQEQTADQTANTLLYADILDDSMHLTGTFPLLTNLAGIHPSLQVASTEHSIIQDSAINSGFRALLLVD